MNKETYYAAFAPGKSPHTSPCISYGLPYTVACVKHVTTTFHAKRIYILASGSLSSNTDALSNLEGALHSNLDEIAVVGVKKGIRPHSFYSDILNIVREAKSAEADCLVTLGAGSLTDAANVVSIALANDANTVDELETLYFDSPTIRTPVVPAKAPIFCVPTSLSAGEFTYNAGATNDDTHYKHSFRHLSMGPRLVIFDPELSKTTPERIWLSTGLKAVDHCIEAICSIKGSPEGDQLGESGLGKLLPGLLKTKASPEQVEPRLQCQLGAVDAISTVLLGIPLGASHGIGHQLGPLGVGHGETSCILLPSVCKWNAPVNGAQQEKVLDILWTEPSISDVLEKERLDRGKADLGDVLHALFVELGMPRSLKEVGIGRERLPGLAIGSLSDRWCKTNPTPLTGKEHVMEILEMVVGDWKSAFWKDSYANQQIASRQFRRVTVSTHP